MKELVKFSLRMRDVASYLADRYSVCWCRELLSELLSQVSIVEHDGLMAKSGHAFGEKTRDTRQASESHGYSSIVDSVPSLIDLAGQDLFGVSGAVLSALKFAGVVSW